MDDAVADDMKKEEEFYNKTHITYYKHGKAGNGNIHEMATIGTSWIIHDTRYCHGIW